MLASKEDPIETLIGGFGKNQSWMLFLMTVGSLPSDYQLNNVVFLTPGVEYLCLDNNITDYCPCENPLYDESEIVSSVTSEWDLICRRGFLASIAQSILPLGSIIGAIVYSQISDRYGRKTAALTSMSLQVVFVVCSAVVPAFWMFLVLRFLIGTSVGGVHLCCFVLLIEMCGKSFRHYAMGLEEVSFILGYITLPIIAYYVREWRHLQLVTSVPWVLTWSFFWLMPESPRWLITNGKKEEAIKLLTRIAERNNRPTNKVVDVVKQFYEDSETKKEEKANFTELFKTPKVRLYTIVTGLLWMSCSATYYGMSQYLGRLEGNLYLIIIISAASHVPGILTVVFATRYFKRRISVISSLIVAAAFLLTFIFIPYSLQALYLSFAIIGQLATYAAFAMMYLYSSEIFPTVLRNTGIGFAAVLGKTGGFLAPFIVNIGVEWISLVIFSGIALFAAVICIFLPETKNIVLPDTIDQTERLKDTQTTI